MLQAGLSLAVNYTVMKVTAVSSLETFAAVGASQSILWSDYVGFSLFAIGFLFEVIGDAQLTKHIANTDPEKGKFCKTGLWRYTRHPNYFGEALLWWGFFIVALGVPKGYLTFFSPLIISLLLRYVSGVPLLERKARKHPEWAQYEAETSVFFPWFWDKDAVPKQDDNFTANEEDRQTSEQAQNKIQ